MSPVLAPFVGGGGILVPYGADVGSTCQCDEGAKRGRWVRRPRVEAVRGCGEPQSHSHTDLKSPLLFIAPVPVILKMQVKNYSKQSFVGV